LILARNTAVTALLTHPACLEHETPRGHPETPARLAAVLEALSGDDFAGLRRFEAPLASLDQLALVHEREFIDALLDVLPTSGLALVDSDTAVSPGSRDAVLRAVGASVRAADLVMSGEVQNAFCAVRPPGHHATPVRAMGFCLFNGVAIAASHVRQGHGVERVAVVDFDVHHGNGTEACFIGREGLFYGSTHQSPLYPGTGRESAGNIVNRPLPPGAGGAEFRPAFASILDEVSRFRPDFIFISAGFDAHRDDHMAQMKLEDADYAWATEQVCALAAESCQGRVVSTLEGGYDLPSLGRSVRAHVQALMAA
jgi:acetoin utilization deacetylase AcuC-like enzyme